ncbi:MarR family winged helix-turn-helix transcriptional regulator [Secundilactobacillus mixtipabuli]|uniref:MarR family transcriptional regulator n=1 Tax=Secundilactobacillus mixtipabuli TaxID=1435342 RepID=A0A1Z5ID29_9LACO|nr:MarR family transcriptional regulator [Secundilactobacillus mixtipabuli]GAW99575.1 MarR family transcriptional regulator [Secundilactobacillus mixtipabuli]
MTEKRIATTAELIYQVGQLEGQIIQRQLADIGIRMDHARLLHYVSEAPGTNQVRLAKYLNVQPATLTNMIKKLEKQDLVVRRIDPEDSHQRQVFLLPQGEKAAKKITTTFHQLNDIVASVNLAKQGSLQALSEQLNDHLARLV